VIAQDAEGNTVEAGDIVYTSEAVKYGSGSKRLLRCYVEEVLSGKKLRLRILEGCRKVNKYSYSVVRPLQ